MSFLPKLKQWLDEAKVKREYYREGSDARAQLEIHIKMLEDTIFKIEHPEVKRESGQAADGSEEVS